MKKSLDENFSKNRKWRNIVYLLNNDRVFDLKQNRILMLSKKK